MEIKRDYYQDKLIRKHGNFLTWGYAMSGSISASLSQTISWRM